MTLRQQLVADRVTNLVTSIGIPEDQAFERFIHSLVTGQSVHSLDPADWVDGAQDKQIDLISIEEDDADAEVFIISAKFTDGFSSNAIILMRNGLQWVFNRPRAEVATISNEAFRDKILEVRSVLSGIGPSNIRVRCYFATNGLTSGLSDEYQQEVRAIKAEYDNGTFAEFSFETLGADELVALINRMEKRNRSIDADVAIRYDANTPSLIRYQTQGLKGIICTATAREIANLVIADSSGALFDSNIRRFLGKGKSVNADILKTATDAASSYLFWFLNNGVTIVCDGCDPVTDPDNPKVKIKNLQIVNGCQTATALAHAERDGVLRPDTRVLLKIFETTDTTLSSRIVLTTNNQNRISTRDLKANDAVQVDMQRGFERYSLLYEHKVNQYATATLSPGQRIISNEDVGQAFLAIALKKPGDARRRKYKVWTDNYSQIFSGSGVEPHVICLLIYQAANAWARTARRAAGITELRRKLINNALLHIARITSFLWRGSDSFAQSVAELQVQIATLQATPNALNPHLDEALNRLDALITANPDFANDVDGALKSALLETAITRSLHPSAAAAAVPAAPASAPTNVP
ncbi:MAG: AIPR family protein [Verrucomicrobia bacterium]|nr:AIPR family protein [Verrucomicrobiota bacterium]